MNICFPSLTYSFNGAASSGVGSQVRLLAHGLIDAGHTASVIDLAVNQSTVVTDDRGVEVYREPCVNFHWFLGKLPLVGKIIALPAREIEYGIAAWRGVRKANRARRVHLIEGTETGMLLLALFWKKSPVIIRLHGEQYTFHKYTPGVGVSAAVRLSRRLQRIALRRAKLLISPSYAHAREIRNELGGQLPPIVVVPNALGIAKSNGHRQNTDSPTVLYAGRIEQLKGIRTLLHAAAQTRDVLPQSQFIFAGSFHSSVSPAEFQSLVRQYQLDGHVNLLGPVGWNVLADLYRKATVAVLPSHYETFGLAALEPMSFGTPVVACNSSALPEVVVNEKNGKLVASGDYAALANAMIEILSQPALRERMSKAAIAHAALFDVKKVLPLNERLYEWCVNDPFDEAGSHVYFSPHLDDAVLSCGGGIERLASQKKNVRVITVFTGTYRERPSAFARHLHAKWNVNADPVQLRRHEDWRALRELGVTNIEHWQYDEAAYRHAQNGDVLYGSYDDLVSIAEEDRQLADVLTERILEQDFLWPDTCLYFPLALGNHADHRILFDVGLALAARGRQVRFYEDFPYAEKYDRGKFGLNWLPRKVSIDLASKLKAAAAYISQLPGLGGSQGNLEKRLRAFGFDRESKTVVERYWEAAIGVHPTPQGNSANWREPLTLSQPTPRLRDFKNFLRTFRWGSLEEMLPVGSGDCLDLGCGNGRHRSSIESRGYEWLGMDKVSGVAAVMSDAASVPLPSNSQAAVVAWQILEYVDRPEDVFAEVARVLESGGVFCGSASFLEPLHGRTYYNLSPVILEKLLRENGFGDVEIKPGLNGFALLLWTWLRRSRIPVAAAAAIPLAFLLLVPLAGFLFCVSWFGRLMRFGSGHYMRWISQRAPLEFAGHLMFSARKRARK